MGWSTIRRFAWERRVDFTITYVALACLFLLVHASTRG